MSSLMSCEDYFGEDSNVDPDNPIEVTANVILPQVQARMAYTYGGDLTRYLGINTQHVDGVGRQFAVIGKYGIIPSDVDQAWKNIYTGTLQTNRKLIKLAEEAGFNHYTGIAKILEAYTVMMATDAWGDIPYSDALNFEGNGVYAPKVDDQESVYNAIFELLDEARVLLASDNGGNAPGVDDLIYPNVMTPEDEHRPLEWIKFANVLEARGRLHLTKRDPNNYSLVIDAIKKGGFSSSADDANFAFGSGATENAPWYQYIEQRDDCEVGAGYVAVLEAMNDPRLASYGATHDLPHPVFTKDQEVDLLSYAEQQFMLAEAYLATSKSSEAWDNLLLAVAASFMDAGVDGADSDMAEMYLNDNGINFSNLDMEDVMTQKYLALYTSPEVFNDWRRTGFPNLTPVSGTEIPRRLPYSEAEQFSNANIPTPAQITIYDRVWWDE